MSWRQKNTQSFALGIMLFPNNWWKTTEILETQYKTLETEVVVEERYSIPEYTITEDGFLSVYVNKGIYTFVNAIREITTKERQHVGPFQRTIDVVNIEKKEVQRTLEEIVPAVDVQVEVSCDNCVVEREMGKTNEKGYAQMHLVSKDHDFAFSLDFLVGTEVAENIRAHGWPDPAFANLLSVYAEPRTYVVTVETQTPLKTRRQIALHGYTLNGVTAEEVLGYYPYAAQ